MARVTLDEDINEIAAKMPGVREQLAKTATVMGARANAVLTSHHGRTLLRGHRNKPPKIVVGSADLDWYVGLEAGSVPRATGIEYGHRYQPRWKNRSGPWGQSDGVGALAAAVGFAVAGWGGA